LPDQAWPVASAGHRVADNHGLAVDQGSSLIIDGLVGSEEVQTELGLLRRLILVDKGQLVDREGGIDISFS
jgi:hypothetical protein